MLISGILFLCLIVWIAFCVVISLSAKTRKIGLISLGISLTATALTFWWGDSGNMVDEPPSNVEIIGTWECNHVSPGFFSSSGLSPEGFKAKLIFKDAESVVVEGMPDTRDTVSFSSTWKLVCPRLTPSGAWTIEIDSGPRFGPYRFVCRKKLGRMTLKKNIDVIYGYKALYRRVTDKN